MTNIDNSVMDWNDVIEDDGQEFVLLPEGDYNFVVTNFERGRFPGSAKIPAKIKTPNLLFLVIRAIVEQVRMACFAIFPPSYLLTTLSYHT